MIKKIFNFKNLIILGAIVIILMGYLLINTESRSLKQCYDRFINESWSIGCLVAKARSLESVDSCNSINISRKNEQHYCVAAFATVNKDKQICNNLTEDNQKNECLLSYAYYARDAVTCTEFTLSTLKDECFRRLSYCDKVVDERIRDKCFSSFLINRQTLRQSSYTGSSDKRGSLISLDESVSIEQARWQSFPDSSLNQAILNKKVIIRGNEVDTIFLTSKDDRASVVYVRTTIPDNVRFLGFTTLVDKAEYIDWVTLHLEDQLIWSREVKNIEKEIGYNNSRYNEDLVDIIIPITEIQDSEGRLFLTLNSGKNGYSEISVTNFYFWRDMIDLKTN